MTSTRTALAREVRDAVEELSTMLAGDGASLHLTGVDERTGSVALSLQLEGADCADCILPPSRLHDVVHARLRTVDGFKALLLTDPREDHPAAEVIPLRAAQTLRVLDPTAGVVAGDPDPGPDAGLLRGKSVGIRVDVLWAAWDQVVSEWTASLEAAGAIVTTWRRAQGLKGAEGERQQREYDAFVGSVDVVISGLGNCGSCTSWSVKDGLNALVRGMPAIVAVTEHFELLGRTLAGDDGRPGLRLVVLPASLNVLPEDEVRSAARSSFPQLLKTLGARTS